MGHKIHPTGLRLGITQEHRSRWYASSKNYPALLQEDDRIRKFIHKKYGSAGISDVLIARKADQLEVELKTARPGVLVGRFELQIGWNGLLLLRTRSVLEAWLSSNLFKAYLAYALSFNRNTECASCRSRQINTSSFYIGSAIRQGHINRFAFVRDSNDVSIFQSQPLRKVRRIEGRSHLIRTEVPAASGALRLRVNRRNGLYLLLRFIDWDKLTT